MFTLPLGSVALLGFFKTLVYWWTDRHPKISSHQQDCVTVNTNSYKWFPEKWAQIRSSLHTYKVVMYKQCLKTDNTSVSEQPTQLPSCAEHFAWPDNLPAVYATVLLKLFRFAQLYRSCVLQLNFSKCWTDFTKGKRCRNLLLIRGLTVSFSWFRCIKVNFNLLLVSNLSVPSTNILTAAPSGRECYAISLV